MTRKIMWGLVVSAAIGVAAVCVRHVSATPASGFTGTTIAMGRFGEIDVSNGSRLPDGISNPQSRSRRWLSFQKTRGPSDLFVQNNLWMPGGSTGWHTHPGHSLIVVTAGEVTAYEGDDPSCSPTVYRVGQGFIDPGDGHVHLLRNEGGVEARTVAVQLIPAGETRRIDAPAPVGCPF
jgi:hypothetical protein